MRILQVLPALSLGGVERGTVDLALYLQKQGVENYVISAGGAYVSKLRERRVPHLVVDVKSFNPFLIIKNIYLLYRFIKKHHITLIHVRSRVPAWSVYYAAKWARIPMVSTIHGEYSNANIFKKFFNKKMFDADTIIAVSHYIKKYIAIHFPSALSRVTTIHRGVDLNAFQSHPAIQKKSEALLKKWHIDPSKKLLIFPARLTRIKGHLLLIEALKHIKTEIDWLCIIVGGGEKKSTYWQSVQAKIKDLNLEERVCFFQAEQEMPPVYNLAYVALCCSIKPEAFGRTITEAYAMGIPVIASNHGGATETVVDGKTGWLYEPHDPKALAAAIEKALHLKEKDYQQMQQNARARVQDYFSLEKMCSETFKLYKKIHKTWDKALK